MADDQLLRAHEVMEYVYNIADVEYPVSIRDQMNRARWLVDKAHDLGFFSPRRKVYTRLLVCGAGAAGVTAALRAVDLGIKTVLVEKAPMPFQRQRGCNRWIDPTQYDWSVDHWDTGNFPHAGPAMPLAWPAARSSRLALRWSGRLLAAIGNPLLAYRCPDHVTGVPTRVAVAGNVGVRVNFHSGGPPEDFGMILWCVGFGDERRHVRRVPPPPVGAHPDYVGFAFWETDPFEHPDWGVASPPDDLRALVSGGGDGGLQDVIRLSTLCKSAAEVLKKIMGTPPVWSIPVETCHRLLAAEDQAQRALTWCRRQTADEHAALQELHDAYVKEVDELTRVHHSRGVLIRQVANVLNANPHPVTFVHSCTHFNRGYGLNHFLVLLLAKVAELQKLPAGLFILPQRGVDSVSGHACAGNPWACHGQVHKVQLNSQVRCFNPPLVVPLLEEVLAHVLVIRHGIAPNPAFVATPLAFARQILPYHLPG